jgi:peptidyl-prolyl cis-trans isomerase SurA
MKLWKLSIGVVFVAAATWMAVPPSLRATTRLVERVIARVNENIITQRQFDEEQKKLHAELAQQYSGPELDAQFAQGKKNLLRDLIDQNLLVQKAKDDDIDVETDVIKKLDQIRRQYNVNSLEDLQKMVEKEGIIWEDFKDQIKRNLLMQQVIEREVGGSIIVTQADARAYFDANKDKFERPAGVHLAEILVSETNRKPEDAKQRADAALAEINNGAKWDDVVSKYSDDQSAADEGDVGFFKEGTLAPALADAVAKVDIGGHSGVLDTKFGYMILRVVDRSSGGIPTFTDVEQQVEQYLYNQKMQANLRTFLYTLRQQSYIRLAPGFVDTGDEPPIPTKTAEKGR